MCLSLSVRTHGVKVDVAGENGVASGLRGQFRTLRETRGNCCKTSREVPFQEGTAARREDGTNSITIPPSSPSVCSLCQVFFRVSGRGWIR